jgi:hypothetical protein
MRLLDSPVMVTDSYLKIPEERFVACVKSTKAFNGQGEVHLSDAWNARPRCNSMTGAGRNGYREKAVWRLRMNRMTQHVLLVDDDPVVRDLVREYLQGHGLAVCCTTVRALSAASMPSARPLSCSTS